MSFSTQVASTAVEAVAYQSGTQRLWVKFTGGRCYGYEGVLEDLAVGILSASSVGQYINRHIKTMQAEEIPEAEFEAHYRVALNSGAKGFVLMFPGMYEAAPWPLRRAA